MRFALRDPEHFGVMFSAELAGSKDRFPALEEAGLSAVANPEAPTVRSDNVVMGRGDRPGREGRREGS